MRVDAATLAGGQRNQDAYAVTGNAVIVLDGASEHPPRGPARDGGWYAGVLLGSLVDRVQDDESPLVACLADSIIDVRDQYGLSSGGPSSTVLIARARGSDWEVLVLGDSTIVIERTSGAIEVISDDRLASLATHERAAYRSRLRGGSGFDDQHATLLAQLQTAQRAQRNRDDGYWIAEADPNAAHRAIRATIPAHDVQHLALLTDGASSAVTRYQSPGSWAELLSTAGRIGCAATIAQVAADESSDSSGRRWPRAKCRDDKTLVLITP